MPVDAQTQKAIDQLRKIRQQGASAGPAPAPAGGVGAGLDRLGALLSGQGPLTDADLMNMRRGNEQLVDVRERVAGIPKPANYGQDVNLRVEDDDSGPLRWLRLARQSIGF